jgi:hypothetical protein
VGIGTHRREHDFSDDVYAGGVASFGHGHPHERPTAHVRARLTPHRMSHVTRVRGLVIMDRCRLVLLIAWSCSHRMRKGGSPSGVGSRVLRCLSTVPGGATPRSSRPNRCRS